MKKCRCYTFSKPARFLVKNCMHCDLLKMSNLFRGIYRERTKTTSASFLVCSHHNKVSARKTKVTSVRASVAAAPPLVALRAFFTTPPIIPARSVYSSTQIQLPPLNFREAIPRLVCRENLNTLGRCDARTAPYSVADRELRA